MFYQSVIGVLLLTTMTAQPFRPNNNVALLISADWTGCFQQYFHAPVFGRINRLT
jgi:hypothetical protein